MTHYVSCHLRALAALTTMGGPFEEDAAGIVPFRLCYHALVNLYRLFLSLKCY